MPLLLLYKESEARRKSGSTTNSNGAGYVTKSEAIERERFDKQQQGAGNGKESDDREGAT